MLHAGIAIPTGKHDGARVARHFRAGDRATKTICATCLEHAQGPEYLLSATTSITARFQCLGKMAGWLSLDLVVSPLVLLVLAMFEPRHSKKTQIVDQRFITPR